MGNNSIMGNPLKQEASTVKQKVAPTHHQMHKDDDDKKGSRPPEKQFW